MDHELALIARRQDGVVSAADVDARQLPQRVESGLYRSGFLRRIAPGAYAVGGAPTTHRMRLRAGLLSLGDASWVSYEAAAALHRLDRSNSEAVEFTVLRERRRSNRVLAVHTTKWMPLIDQVTVDGFRCTSATRTILDLAHGRAGRRRVEAAIDSAVRLGLSSPHAIARRLEHLRGSGRWGCRLVEELVVDSGGHSPLERRFLQLVRRAGIERPTLQAIRRKGSRHIARVDFLFERQGVVIEVSGQHGHASPTERARDAQRRNELQDVGHPVYEYTYRDVMWNDEMVIRTLRRRLDRSS